MNPKIAFWSKEQKSLKVWRQSFKSLLFAISVCVGGSGCRSTCAWTLRAPPASFLLRNSRTSFRMHWNLPGGGPYWRAITSRSGSSSLCWICEGGARLCRALTQVLPWVWMWNTASEPEPRASEGGPCESEPGDPLKAVCDGLWWTRLWQTLCSGGGPSRGGRIDWTRWFGSALACGALTSCCYV